MKMKSVICLSIFLTMMFKFLSAQEDIPINNDSLIAKHLSYLRIINPKEQIKYMIEQAGSLEQMGNIEFAIDLYSKVLSIDSTLNKVNFEIGRLWNKLGDKTADTIKFNNSIKAFEKYLSSFKVKSKEYRKGEKDSTKYFETSQYVIEINDKNLSLKQQLKEIDKYNSILKSYEGLWISYFFSKDRLVPQWIFCIEKDSLSGVFSLELHPSCNRFSDETPNQKVYPILLEDESLAFRFSKKQTFVPSQSKYYLKHLLVDLSNPVYPLAVMSMSDSKKISGDFPEDYIERQEERDAKLHAQLEQQLVEEISKARIEKTEEEFIIKSVSESTMSAVCREIIANPGHRSGHVFIDTLNCIFYKIPDDLTFIILGRGNKQFKNKEHSKEALKDIGFTKWNNLSITGNVLKHTGYLTLCGGLTVANGYLGGGAFAWETYRMGIQLFGEYFTNVGNENMMRNPTKWNSKMYNILFNYYEPEGNLKLENASKQKMLSKKEKRKDEKEKRKLEKKEKREKENEMYRHIY